MTTDPRDAEIARLTAANNALKGSLTVLDEGYRRVEAERDAALAQMRAEGRKNGMREAAEIADAKDPDKPTNYLHWRENIPAAILAAAEKDAPHG